MYMYDGDGFGTVYDSTIYSTNYTFNIFRP